MAQQQHEEVYAHQKKQHDHTMPPPMNTSGMRQSYNKTVDFESVSAEDIGVEFRKLSSDMLWAMFDGENTSPTMKGAIRQIMRERMSD